MNANSIKPKLCIEDTGQGSQITITGEAEHCIYAYALLGAKLSELSGVSIRKIALYLLSTADTLHDAIKKYETGRVDMSFTVPDNGEK